MKFVIAGLIGHVSALPKYATPSDCSSTSKTTCNGAAGYDKASGLTNNCIKLMRGQATATLEYWASDFFGTWDTETNLVAKQGVQCTTDATAGTPVVPNASVCTLAASGANVKTDWTGFTKAYGMDNAIGGSPISGAMLCSQSEDKCDTGTTKWGKNKVKTFKDKSESAIAVKLGNQSDKQACSYIVEATCDAPYAQVLPATSSTWDATNQDKMTYTVAEWTPSSAYQWSNADALKFSPAGFTAITGLTKNSAGDLEKVFNWKMKAADKPIPANTGDTKQGLFQDNFPSVKLHQFDNDSTGIVTNAYFLMKMIGLKKDEFKKFEAQKAEYETQKNNYNTKLEAAEKLKKEVLSKDIFRAASPTEEDKKVFNAVPKRPNNPTVPDAYAGPKLLKASPTNADYINTVSKNLDVDGDAYIGAWSSYQYSDMPGTGKAFAVGKSWGTRGFGKGDGKAIAEPYKDIWGSMNNKAITWSKYSSGTTCAKHYMMVQAGVKDFGVTTDKAIEIKMGVNEFYATMDLPETPSAASDPETPSTGATMLASGVASIALAMSLF